MNFNVLTLTLNNFIAAFSGGYGRMSGAANGLLTILGGIDLVLLGFWWALGGGEQLVAVFKKLLYLGFWIWAVRSFPSLAKAFVESLVAAGTMAGGGGSTNILLDPSAIAARGLDATEPLAKKINDLGALDIADMVVFGLCFLLIMICFFVMAINCFLAVLEYYLIVALVGIFLPFALFPSTKFLAEKALGAVVAAGVKLMTLSFVMAVVAPTLGNIKFAGSEIATNELFAMLLTAAGCAFLAWQAPRLAAGLMSGSPSLGAGDVAQQATGVAGLAAMPFAALAATRAAASGSNRSGDGERSSATSAASSALTAKAGGSAPLTHSGGALGGAALVGSWTSAKGAPLGSSGEGAVGKGNSPPPLNGAEATPSALSSPHRSLVKSILRGPSPAASPLLATKLLVS
jgi:type IV secretion system protein TrbL